MNESGASRRTGPGGGAGVTDQPTDVVTGAFGFTGRYIARRLLSADHHVRTLTNHPEARTPFSDSVEARPYRFDDPGRLRADLSDVETLYNTFWMREPGSQDVYETAVEYSRQLVDAAADAGVERIVHLSVSNPEDADLAYYEAKARVEELVADAALSHAILRPTLIFGREDLLVNNLAWFLRRFPVFPVFGDGTYRLRPVFVGDVAEVAVGQGARTEDVTIDVAGPESYRFREFVETICDAIDADTRIVGAPPGMVYAGLRALSLVLRDPILSREEIRGLMDERLYSAEPPRGETKLSDWLRANAHHLGGSYTRLGARHARDE